MAAQHRTHRQLHDAAFLRRRFWVEVVLAVVVGALFGYVTGPFFLDWAGVSLVATENPDPVPATWSNTLLVSLGLFGGITTIIDRPPLFPQPSVQFQITGRTGRQQSLVAIFSPCGAHDQSAINLCP